MSLTTVLSLFIFVVQASFLGYLIFWIFKLKKEVARLQSRPQTYDAQALLTDMLNGTALVKVERLAPNDFLLRSTRR